MGLSCTVSEIDDFSRKLQNFPTLVFCAPAKGFPFELGTGAWGQKLGVKVDPNKLQINVKNKKMPNLMQILSIFLKLKAVKQSGPRFFWPTLYISRSTILLLLRHISLWRYYSVMYINNVSILSAVSSVGPYFEILQTFFGGNKHFTGQQLKGSVKEPNNSIYFFFPPTTQWCYISDVMFRPTGGRGVSDFSVLKYC